MELLGVSDVLSFLPGPLQLLLLDLGPSSSSPSLAGIRDVRDAIGLQQ